MSYNTMAASSSSTTKDLSYVFPEGRGEKYCYTQTERSESPLCFLSVCLFLFFKLVLTFFFFFHLKQRVECSLWSSHCYWTCFWQLCCGGQGLCLPDDGNSNNQCMHTLACKNKNKATGETSWSSSEKHNSDLESFEVSCGFRSF